MARDELVFLSYARSDQAAALRLHSTLTSAGINAWLDVVNLLPGQDWRKHVREAIANCSHFVALLSNQSIERRGYVQSELRHAITVLSEIPEGDIFLIPARLNDCPIPFEELRSLHWVDLFPSFDEGVQRIISAVKATKRSAPDEKNSADITSTIDLIDVRSVGGGAFAWIDSEEPLIDDKRATVVRHGYFESREHKLSLPLARILKNPDPGSITRMLGTACAFSFHLVLKPTAPWAIIRPPHVVVNHYEPLPKYHPSYPLPAMHAHIYYVEIDNPEVSGTNSFSSKYLVYTRKEKAGGAFSIHSDIAELTSIRLIPDVPEFFVVRVNALTPGVYGFDVAVEARIFGTTALIRIREGCKYLFETQDGPVSRVP